MNRFFVFKDCVLVTVLFQSVGNAQFLVSCCPHAGFAATCKDNQQAVNSSRLSFAYLILTADIMFCGLIDFIYTARRQFKEYAFQI
jgi:hypothetical protein